MSVWQSRDGRWHAAVEKNGVRSPHVTKITKDGVSRLIASRAEAEYIEAHLLVELQTELARRASGRAATVPLRDALERYIAEIPDEDARRNAKVKVQYMEPWVANRNLSEVNDVAEEMTDDMVARELAPATINRQRAILRRVAHLANEYPRWWRARKDQSDFVPIKLDEPLWRQIKPLPGGYNPRRVRLRDADELASLINACTHQKTKDFITIAFYGGLRSSEVLKVGRVYQIDWLGQHILIPAGKQKNRDPDQIPIVAQIHPLPSMVAALERCPLACCNSTIYHHFKAAATKIGRPELSPHDIRRTTGSVLADNGFSLEIIGQILRHRNLQTTRDSYAHILTQAKREALINGLTIKRVA